MQSEQDRQSGSVVQPACCPALVVSSPLAAQPSRDAAAPRAKYVIALFSVVVIGRLLSSVKKSVSITE
jgi:hypothetical protein